MNTEISTLLDEINERIANREKIYFPLLQRLAPTPACTRQTLLTTTLFPLDVIQNADPTNISLVVDVETVLQNRFFALQKADQPLYVPSAASDLFASAHGSAGEVSLGQGSFKSSLLSSTPINLKNEQTHPNINLGSNSFYNHTRIQLKNL